MDAVDATPLEEPHNVTRLKSSAPFPTPIDPTPSSSNRTKVMPWKTEDVIQFLSKDGDSEPVFLWRWPDETARLV